MTGRLLIDGRGPIEQLEYSSRENDPDGTGRLSIGGQLVAIRDPGVWVDRRRPDVRGSWPDAASSGVDVWPCTADRTASDQGAYSTRTARRSGESAWPMRCSSRRTRSRVDPEVSSSEDELPSFARTVRDDRSSPRGEGSHTGDTVPAAERRRRYVRSMDDASVESLGGRTTWWCPTRSTVI